MLNAVGFFKPVGGGKSPFNQNQFGGAFGGPIKKDKMFFFADYEGFRRVSHPVQFATVPTTAMDQGDFSAFKVPIANPLNGAQYPNGIIPQSQFTPVAARGSFRASRSESAGKFQQLRIGARATRSTTTRAISVSITSSASRCRSSAGIARRTRESSIPIRSPIPSAPATTTATCTPKSKQAVVGGTWTVSPTSVLEVRANVTYMLAGKTPPSLGLNTPQFYIPNQPTDPSLAGGLFSVNLNGGLSALGRSSSNPQFQNPFVANPKVVFTKIVRRHSLKTGFEYQLIDTAVNDFHPQYGTENFAGTFSDPDYFTNPERAEQPERRSETGVRCGRFYFRRAQSLRARQQPGRAPAPADVFRLLAG